MPETPETPNPTLDESSIQIPDDLPQLEGDLSRAARVLLAMDVRTRLLAEKPDVRLRMGTTYFRCAQGRRLRTGAFDSSKIPTKACEVCARGALFLASVDRYNECQIEAVPTEKGMLTWPPAVYEIQNLVCCRSLEDFGDSQANEIEAAFEDREAIPAKRTMLAICENLIANHGEFISDQHEEFLAAQRRERRPSRPSKASDETAVGLE